MSQEGKVETAMENLKAIATEGTSGRRSPVVETLASAGKLAGIEYESGGEGGDGKPVPEFGGVPKDDKEEETREKKGGVMHWLGLAGGRKRRRKKSRKKKKKSKSKKRRRKSRRRSRSRRGGIVCKGYEGENTGPECPCPYPGKLKMPEGPRPKVPYVGKKKKEKKAAQRAWDEAKKAYEKETANLDPVKMAKYNECMGKQHNAVYWKEWQLLQQGVTGDELKNQKKAYYESIKGTGVTGAEQMQHEIEKAAREEQERRDKEGMLETTIQAGIDAYDGPPAAPVGGRRRKSRRKKRRKSKKRKSRRRRKKSRKRRR